MHRHLWLIGMMGAGKSSAGRHVADALDLRFVDLDDTISARMGCSIAQFWGERGEAAFRQLEAAALNEAAAGAPAVIATGGGVVLDPDNVATMRASGRVLWLRGTVASLTTRVGADSTRPLLAEQDPEATLGRILEERTDRYEAACDTQLDTDDLTVGEVAKRIEAWWNAS